jgi:hypothetical protein
MGAPAYGSSAILVPKAWLAQGLRHGIGQACCPDLEKATPCTKSAAQKEVNDIRLKNSNSRSFTGAPEGM